MRLRRMLVCAATVGLAAAGWGRVGPPPAEASCPGPQLALKQGGTAAPRSRASENEEFVYVLAAAQQLEVAASNLADGCQDTLSGNPGCGRATPMTPVEPIRPLADLRLVLRQGGHSWTLARAEGPAPDLTASFSVKLPAKARPGAAVLELTSRSGLGNSLQLRLG